MRVNQIASQPVIACRPEDSLERAAQLMWEQDIGFLVVLDGEDRLAGVITDRDICMAAYTRGQRLRAIPVRDVMAHDVFTVEAGEIVTAAEQMMAEHQVRRLPVIDGQGRVIGVLSLNDVAREVKSELWQRHAEVDSAAFSRALGSICEPRRPMIATTHGS